jgi:integrase
MGALCTAGFCGFAVRSPHAWGPAVIRSDQAVGTRTASPAHAGVSRVTKPRKIPVILSPEEVTRLLEAAPGPKYKAALSAAYGAGLRVSEVVALKVPDIDSKRMLLRIEQGKGRKCYLQHKRPYVLAKFMLRWQQDGNQKERCRLLAAT